MPIEINAFNSSSDDFNVLKNSAYQVGELPQPVKERRFKLLYTDHYKDQNKHRFIGVFVGPNPYSVPEDAIIVDAVDDFKTQTLCTVIAHPSFDKVPIGDTPPRFEHTNNLISCLFFYIPADNMIPEECGRVVAKTENEAYQKVKDAMTEDQKSRGIRISMTRLGKKHTDYPEWLCDWDENNIHIHHDFFENKNK